MIDTVQVLTNHASITTDIIENAHNRKLENTINEQINWLINELEKSKNKRKIVFGHYPIITNGFYYNRMKPLYDILFPIFKKYNVDAYISGHEHNIQYINEKNDNYILNQFICGSSADNRKEEFCYNNHDDMFDNNDTFIIELSTINIDKISVKFIDSNNNIKLLYII